VRWIHESHRTLPRCGGSNDAIGSVSRAPRGRPRTKRFTTIRSTGQESPSVTDTEADEMEKHLRGLGYLE